MNGPYLFHRFGNYRNLLFIRFSRVHRRAINEIVCFLFSPAKICVHLYYLRSNSLNFDKQEKDVGAAPCGRPQDGQPQGVAPTISANNAGFPSVWLRLRRAVLLFCKVFKFC